MLLVKNASADEWSYNGWLRKEYADESWAIGHIEWE